MKFGDKVLMLRKQKGWSQHELAEMLGTSGPIVGRYERNEIKPSIEVAKKIADSLEVSIDYLVDESDQLTELKDKKMLDRFSQIEHLPEPEKEHILTVLDAFLRDTKTKVAYSK
jgi:transcriptional regulator with XRE-family HTH domain